jgi:hypothetical protein
MVIICFLAIAGVACSKSSSSNTNTCTATTGDALALTSNKSINYAANASDGATISYISYQDSAGTTTVKNPTLPFSKTVNLKTGQTVSITASGNPNAGEITVSSNGINLNTASCP